MSYRSKKTRLEAAAASNATKKTSNSHANTSSEPSVPVIRGKPIPSTNATSIKISNPSILLSKKSTVPSVGILYGPFSPSIGVLSQVSSPVMTMFDRPTTTTSVSETTFPPKTKISQTTPPLTSTTSLFSSHNGVLHSPPPSQKPPLLGTSTQPPLRPQMATIGQIRSQSNQAISSSTRQVHLRMKPPSSGVPQRQYLKPLSNRHCGRQGLQASSSLAAQKHHVCSENDNPLIGQNLRICPRNDNSTRMQLQPLKPPLTASSNTKAQHGNASNGHNNKLIRPSNEMTSRPPTSTTSNDTNEMCLERNTQNVPSEQHPCDSESRERRNQNEDDSHVDEEVRTNRKKKSKKPTARCPRSTIPIPDWPGDIKFDEKEKVLAIDSENHLFLVSGFVPPVDVMKEVGLKYLVNFNEYHQPLRKGGHILVKFLSFVAKMGRFCPIGEESWHGVKKKYKVEIVELVRSKFVIPTFPIYDKIILRRVDTHWRQYKYELKQKKFNPEERSVQEIYNDLPDGQDVHNWRALVDYWMSEKGQGMSTKGKATRSMQDHLHTTGSTSYADKH